MTDTNAPDTRETLSTIQHLFDCYLKKDLKALLNIVDESCDWRFPGSARILPWAGNYRGHEFTRFAEYIENSIEYITYDAHTIHAQGNLATILSHEQCRVKSTGRIFKNDLVAIAKVENQKLTQFWEYSDTAAMEAAFQTL